MAAEAPRTATTPVATTQGINFFGTVNNNGSRRGQRLPDEVIVQILYLLDILSLLAVTGTCRNGRRLGSDIHVWKRLLMRMRVPSQQLEEANTIQQIKAIAKCYLIPFDKIENSQWTIRRDFYYRRKCALRDEGQAQASGGRRAFDGTHFAYVAINENASTSTVIVANYQTNQMVWRATFRNFGERPHGIRGLAIRENRLAIIETTKCQIWDFVLGHLVHSFENLDLDLPSSVEQATAVLFNEQCIWIGQKACKILEIHLEDGSPSLFGTQTGLDPHVSALHVRNNQLFVGHHNGRISIYDLNTHEHLSSLEDGRYGHAGEITSLTTFGNTLFSAGEKPRDNGERPGYYVTIWDLEEQSPSVINKNMWSDTKITGLSWLNRGLLPLTFSCVTLVAFMHAELMLPLPPAEEQEEA